MTSKMINTGNAIESCINTMSSVINTRCCYYNTIQDGTAERLLFDPLRMSHVECMQGMQTAPQWLSHDTWATPVSSPTKRVGN